MTETADEVSGTSRAAIPRSINEVNAAWLTVALSTRCPGFKVENAELVQSLGGACTKLRMRVRTNHPSFPDSIIVKGCFESHNQNVMTRLQLREVNIYQRLVPRLEGIETVRCLFAEGDEVRGSALILEDLDVRGVRCLRAQEPIRDFELAARFVDSLARLHARWWDGPELAEGGEFHWLPGLDDARLLRFTEDQLSNPVQASEILSRPRGAAIPVELHDRQRLQEACRAIKTQGQGGALVLAHGDPHLSNLFVSVDGRPGFLDWTSRRVPWAFDVTYFIIGCLDVCDRRRWEKRLLSHYLTQLTSYGVTPPDLQEAWLAYRRWAVYGLLVWLFNTTDYHSEASITALSMRFGASVAEHGSFELWGI
jgi:hypothetical protein